MLVMLVNQACRSICFWQYRGALSPDLRPLGTVMLSVAHDYLHISSRLCFFLLVLTGNLISLYIL